MIAQRTTTTVLVPSPIALMRTEEITHPERALRRGEIIRIRRGVLASAEDWWALAPWERYLARVYAVALTHPDVIYCHESAAALLAMPVFGDPKIVHVVSPPTATSRERSGIRTHTSEDDAAIHEVSGLLLTRVGRTAVTLARERPAAIGLAVADAALRIDPTLSREQLIADNESRASSRGRRIAQWALERADAAAETPLESISRAAVEWLGFPPPELQRSFVASSGVQDRVDFWWPELRLAGESDGDVKYTGRFGDPIRMLRDRRERDARLLSGDVRAVAHWGWSDVTAIDPLRGILLGHGLRPIAPEDTLQLHMMRRHLTPRPHA